MRWLRAALVPCTALLMAAVVAPSSGSAAPAPSPGAVQAPSATQVTADALPTVQIDGVAWTQVIVGTTVWVGGDFHTARPAGAAPGTQETVRDNLLAYDITTGKLITAFAPYTNGPVYSLSLSPDHTRLYVGGNFTRAGSGVHHYLAAIDLATHTFDQSFAPVLNAPVHALAATNGPVYVGGNFTVANGNARHYLAAFAHTGALIATWAPSADNVVRALVLSPTAPLVVIGGSFSHLNGISAKGIGAASVYNGATATWNSNQVINDYGPTAGFYNLYTDGTLVYVTGFNAKGTGNLEGFAALNPSDGTIEFMEDCHGDSYGTFVSNGAVYVVSHSHDCYTDGGWPQPPTNFRRSTAWTNHATGSLLADPDLANDPRAGQPAPSLINWFPDLAIGTFTHQNQAAWTITGNDQYLALGGEFPTVNKTPQQGLVRFAVRSIAPKKVGPVVPGDSATPTATQTAPGTVTVTLPGYWDPDGLTVRYDLIRDGNTSHVIDSVTRSGTFWQLPGVSLVDATVLPGSTHTYRVAGYDADGNRIIGRPVTVTLSGS